MAIQVPEDLVRLAAALQSHADIEVTAAPCDCAICKLYILALDGNHPTPIQIRKQLLTHGYKGQDLEERIRVMEAMLTELPSTELPMTWELHLTIPARRKLSLALLTQNVPWRMQWAANACRGIAYVYWGIEVPGELLLHQTMQLRHSKQPYDSKAHAVMIAVLDEMAWDLDAEREAVVNAVMAEMGNIGGMPGDDFFQPPSGNQRNKRRYKH